MSITTPMPTAAKKQRGIWTPEESDYLVSAVKGSEQVDWSKVASNLNATCRSNKTAKQCRERFRNYANPDLDKSEWKTEEKLLFLVLYRLYQNKWSVVAKFFNQRGDVAVKNYFYSIIRRTLKYCKHQTVPAPIIKKPRSLYQAYTVLSFIREYYVPLVCGAQSASKESGREKLIIELVRKRKLDDESIKRYQSLLIDNFRASCEPAELPKEVLLNLSLFNISFDKANELIAGWALYNPAPLSQTVVLRLVSAAPSPKSAPVPRGVPMASPVPPQHLAHSSTPVLGESPSSMYWQYFSQHQSAYLVPGTGFSTPAIAPAPQIAMSSGYVQQSSMLPESLSAGPIIPGSLPQWNNTFAGVWPASVPRQPMMVQPTVRPCQYITAPYGMIYMGTQGLEPQTKVKRQAE